MIPKTKHLGLKYARQFKDRTIVEAYGRRPPYPQETYDILLNLITHEPKTVLDVGCGTGYIARPLMQQVERVDAVDFSQNMITQGQQLPGGDAANLHWKLGAVENITLAPSYALITAGESLHWMDWEIVMSRFRRLLLDGSFLAIVSKRFGSTPWDKPLGRLIAESSTNQDFAPYNLVVALEKRGLFCNWGEQETPPVIFRQTVSDYIESIHSMSGFSRERMGKAAVEVFDTAVYDLVKPYCSDGYMDTLVSGHVVWGIPHILETK